MPVPRPVPATGPPTWSRSVDIVFEFASSSANSYTTFTTSPTKRSGK
jgi:hypothetical protein